jgi:hypothetical protein
MSVNGCSLSGSSLLLNHRSASALQLGGVQPYDVGRPTDEATMRTGPGRKQHEKFTEAGARHESLAASDHRAPKSRLPLRLSLRVVLE